MIISFGEKRAGLCDSRAFVCLCCTRQFLSFFSSSWCRGLVVACDCSTPWTFLLTFLIFVKTVIQKPITEYEMIPFQQYCYYKMCVLSTK